MRAAPSAAWRATTPAASKSIRYGLMADNVAAIDAILADGTRHRFAALPDNLGADIPPAIADLIQRLRALGAAEAEEIAARFPRQLRRVGGYNIDVLTPAARAAGRENLARLLVGSEGTLAFSAAIELTLHPDQAAQGAGHLPVPQLPRRDGGHAAHRRPRPRGGGAGRPHHDRPRPLHPDLPRHHRRHADRRARQPADRRVPRRRGCAAAAQARRRWTP